MFNLHLEQTEAFILAFIPIIPSIKVASSLKVKLMEFEFIVISYNSAFNIIILIIIEIIFIKSSNSELIYSHII